MSFVLPVRGPFYYNSQITNIFVAKKKKAIKDQRNLSLNTIFKLFANSGSVHAETRLKLAPNFFYILQNKKLKKIKAVIILKCFSSHP